MVERRKGGDPKTDQVTQGADSELLGWQPKETERPNCHRKRYSTNSVGGNSAQKGGDPRNPAAQEVKGVAAPLASTWLLRQLLDPEREGEGTRGPPGPPYAGRKRRRPVYAASTAPTA